MPSTIRPQPPGIQVSEGLCKPESMAFRPPGMLSNPHLQSILTQAPWRRRGILRAAQALLAETREVVLDCGAGVRLQGFLSPGRNRRHVVVLLHGWEGSAGSSYILSAGTALLEAGFSVFRLNMRDHGDTKSLNEGLFHSCRIDEVVGAIARVQELTNPERFFVVGQSLGGNFALRVAGRAPAAGLMLNRVIAICPVLKPANTMRALDGGFWLYRRYFLSRWRRSLEEKARAFPDLYRFGDLTRFATLTATTKFFVENYTEFDSLDDYLSGYALTGDVMKSLQVPSRLILADDDPVIPVADLGEIAVSSPLEVTRSSHGGHCGFVESLRGPSWVDREIVSDLRRMV